MPLSNDAVVYVSAPASPCINVCTLDARGCCTGCGRSSAEIAGWSRMSPAERWAVIARLEQRSRSAGP